MIYFSNVIFCLLKMHEVGEKGLFRTLSDTVSGIFGSHSSHITTTSSPQAQQFHVSTSTNTKIPQHGTEVSYLRFAYSNTIENCVENSVKYVILQ